MRICVLTRFLNKLRVFGYTMTLMNREEIVDIMRYAHHRAGLMLRSTTQFLEDNVHSYFSAVNHWLDNRTQERERQRYEHEKQRAPGDYKKLLKELGFPDKNDFNIYTAGDVCFLQRFEKEPDLYQRLLKIRKASFEKDKL